MNKLALAFAIVAEAFKNKLDKGGKPYILHCIYVMEGCDPDNEDEQIAALMHDLIEDCPEWTMERLHDLGFSTRTLSILDKLTHKPGDDYDTYIRLCSFDASAKKIKKRDLRHNSDITRIKGLRKKDHERIEKYHRAYIYLSE